MDCSTCDQLPQTLSEPRSWAEDLLSYRFVRGSLAYAAANGPVRTVSRTTKCPLGATRHPQYTLECYDARPRTPDFITKHRWERHGWGDGGLLKIDEWPTEQPAPPTRSHPASAPAMLSQDHDAWIGHILIHPSKGKRPVLPPQDPKGRKDLFQVLNLSSPATMADDSWLGHIACDPAKGKKSVPGPEKVRGRSDLFKIIQQEAVKQVEAGGTAGAQLVGVLRKGEARDPLADAWLGHRLIDPTKGKLAIGDSPASKQNLWGPTFKEPSPANWTDFGRLGKKTVPLELLPTIARSHKLGGGSRGHADAGSAGQAFWWKRTRRLIAEPRNPCLPAANSDIYAAMTYVPMDQVETQALTDHGLTGLARKRTFPTKPGDAHPHKGRDMLHWRPDTKVEYHYGKRMLAQLPAAAGAVAAAEGVAVASDTYNSS